MQQRWEYYNVGEVRECETLEKICQMRTQVLGRSLQVMIRYEMQSILEETRSDILHGQALFIREKQKILFILELQTIDRNLEVRICASLYTVVGIECRTF